MATTGDKTLANAQKSRKVCFPLSLVVPILGSTDLPRTEGHWSHRGRGRATSGGSWRRSNMVAGRHLRATVNLGAPGRSCRKELRGDCRNGSGYRFARSVTSLAKDSLSDIERA